MDKTILKKLVENTISGNFQYAHKYIKTNKIEEYIALKLVVACCNACNNNITTPEKLKEEDLVALIKCLLSCIKRPLTEQTDCYLQSVFFILKLLVEKRSFQCILQLEEMFLPDFLPLIFDEKQSGTYLNICKSIYNIIVKIANNQGKQYRNSIVKLCYLLSSLYKRVDVTKLIESVHNCLVSLTILNVRPEEIQQYYHNFLDLLEYTKNPQFFNSLINNFSFMYTCLFKNENFDAATTCYLATVQKLTTIFKTKEYRELFEIIEIVKWLNPQFDSISNEVPKKAHTNLKIYYKKYQSTPDLQAICDLISSVALVTLQYYKNGNSEKWVQKPHELQIDYYKFLQDISHIMAKTPYQCHCKVCPTKTNLNEALRALNTILGLARLSITTTSRNYKIEVSRYVDRYIEHVTQMKDNKCVKWRNYWNDAGVHLYAIGVTLLKNHDYEMSIQFLRRFIQALLVFEGLTPQIIDKTYLIGAFGAIAEAYTECKDYERCLFVTALNITLNGAPKSEINRWIKTKVTCRDSTILEMGEIQELTLTSVCRKFDSEISHYDSKRQFGVTTDKQIELLIYELKNYKLKWKSKIPMMSVFRELTQIADSSVLGETFIEIWGDCCLQVHEHLPKLLQNTIKRLEIDTKDNRSIQVKFHLAYLYFLQHKYRVKDTIIKHCDEMEKTMLNMTKTAIENEPIPPDPNEECDIISSYDCLKLSKYLHMMKELTKSLETLQEVFATNFDRLEGKDKLFKLLTKIGHEYKLHDYATKSLQAWELALKLANFENNPLYVLQASSFIIEMSDVTKPSIEKLVSVAETIANMFLLQATNLEEAIIFFLCKSEAYFYVDFETAYEAFQLVEKICHDHNGDDMLKARVCWLHHRFVTLPCRFEVEGHREFSLVKIHLAHNHAVKHYTDNISDSAYHMRIFFEINETLVRMYHDLRLPREVRCYCKEVVMIAQKMVLPFRTSTCLYYLAHADISSCRLDDCRVKIMGLSDILDLSKSVNLAKSRNGRPEEAKFDRLIDNLVSEFREMMLDVPSRFPKSGSPGSPALTVETFTLPVFLNHEETCECFYCTCLEYHQSVLKKTYLHALLYEHSNNLSVAKEYFCGCIKIYEYLKSRQDVYLKKVARELAPELIASPEGAFIETYCLILYEYGNVSLRSGRPRDADRINKKLLQILESFPLKWIHLYNEVLVQRLNILSEKVLQGSTASKSPTLPDKLNVAHTDKTPESKQSRVVLSPQRHTEYFEVPKYPKNLKFNLSDDDEEENATAKKVPPKYLPSFINVGAKTPAPSTSKIKIYTNKSTKKKRVLGDIPPPKGSNEFVVPMSPEAYTPSSRKVDNNRTRLLTTRLKSDNVPSIVITDEKSVRQNLLGQLEGADGTPSSVDSILLSRTKLLTSKLKRNGENVPSTVIQDSSEGKSGKASVRKNLLTQLGGAEDAEAKGVRRSARNRK